MEKKIETNEQIWEVVKMQLRQVGKWISRSNTYNLADLARSLPDKSIILDIGTGGATSACIMALANPSARVFTMDPLTPPVLMETVIKTKTKGRVWFTPGTSDEVFSNWDMNIGMLFHDSLHEYEQVLKDVEKFSRWLYTGSILAFHDYDLYNIAVGRAVDKFIANHKEQYDLIKHEDNLIAYRKV